MSEKIELDVDTEPIISKLKAVDKLRQDVEGAATASFNQVVGMARASYMLIKNVVQAAGGTIPATLEAIISGTISAIAILKPLLTATAVTPGMQAQAAIGFANLVLTFAALSAAQQKKADIQQTIAGVNGILTGISALIGTINF